MTNAQLHLERPVSFRTAAKKLAAIRGDEGRAGGWIYNRYGKPVAQGWNEYGRHLMSAGLIVQDDAHNGQNGKWYIWLPGLTERELALAEALSGAAR